MNRLLIFLLSSLVTTTNFCMKQQIAIAKDKAKAEAAAEAGAAHEALRPVQLHFNDSRQVELSPDLLPVLQTAHNTATATAIKDPVLKISRSSKDIEHFIDHTRAFVNERDLWALMPQTSLEQNINCLYFAYYLNANEPILDAYASEIARKLMLPTILNQFFNNPHFLRMIDQINLNMCKRIIRDLRHQSPFRLESVGQINLTPTKVVKTHNITMHDDKKLVINAGEKVAYILDAKTEQCLHTLEGHTEQINDADYFCECFYTGQNHKMGLILTASNDHTTRIWDVNTGRCLQVLQGHTSWVSLVGIGQCFTNLSSNFYHDYKNPNSLRIITNSYDGTRRIWTNILNIVGDNYHESLKQALLLLACDNLKQRGQPIVLNKHTQEILDTFDRKASQIKYSIDAYNIKESWAPFLSQFSYNFSACLPWSQVAQTEEQAEQDHKKNDGDAGPA